LNVSNGELLDVTIILLLLSVGILYLFDKSKPERKTKGFFDIEANLGYKASPAVLLVSGLTTFLIWKPFGLVLVILGIANIIINLLHNKKDK
jgi:hypothetical protein